MRTAGLAVTVHSGASVPIPARAVEVDGGVTVPVAFAGLRKILSALRTVAPGPSQRAAQTHPAEWNRLFPGAVDNAPDLSDLALSPSERRLHRESEQTFWILNLAARVVLESLAESGRPLVIRNAGESDLVSLRGLMRAVEWARIDGVGGQIVLGGWDQPPAMGSPRFDARRRAHLAALRERMRAPVHASDGAGGSVRSVEAPVDPESSYLQAAIDPHGSPERRIAAAILAVRACFFSTNYEGAMLAAEEGLSLIDQIGSALDPSAVGRAFDGLDHSSFVSPAIEVDRSSIGDAEELRALFLRQIGVVQAFTGEFEVALATFLAGAERKLSPERHAQMRMFRALTLIKRVGNIEKARAEIEAGLQGMAGRQSDATALHEGWLRNVYALTYFQEKKLEQALGQEKLAMKCVGDLHDPSATHLKINLISNVSVVQESAKRFADAITTWRRFEKISSNWGANFFKHHGYRLGGLQLRAGEREEAVRNYSGAYASAVQLGDAFHRQGIAAELGRYHLEAGDSAEAQRWFENAIEAARAIGDPFRLAQSVAGLSLVKGERDFSEAQRLAAESTSYGDEPRGLIDALATGEPEKIRTALPAPRSKLNRPFDLVNLY